MKISKQQSTHYLFVGGVSPYMNEDELKAILSGFGPIHEVVLKKRTKAPFYNLGYGIVSTKSYRVYKELMEVHFFQIEQCKLEFKDYKDPKEAVKQNTVDSVNYSVLLQGLTQGMTDALIIKAIQSKSPSVKVLNLVLRKNYLDGLLTGEAKVIFQKAQDVKDIRRILPLEIKFTHPSTGETKRAILSEKNPY